MLGDSSVVDDMKFQLAGSDEEFDARTVQNFEKEFLGFYVTSHPLQTIRDKLPFLMTHKITELAELPNDKPATICGLITAVKKIPTKKDPTKFLKFVTVEDLSGKVDVICFHRKLQEFDTFLEPEQRVIVSGKVNRRDEDEAPSLVVDSVKPIDNSNIFNIELLDDFKFEELMLIKSYLTAHAGSDPVTVTLKDSTGTVKILSNSGCWVNTSNDLVNVLKAKFAGRIEVNVRSLDSKLA